MVEQILQGLTMYMMAGIILVVGVSQVSRLAGGILGVLFWCAVGVVGSMGYDRGGGIGVPGFMFPRELFYFVCIGFAGLSGFAAYKAWLKRVRFERSPPQDGDA